MTKMKNIVKGFKGFNRKLKCRDMQYEIGKTFEADAASLCEHGLHFCEYPLDCFNYYSPAHSRFCAVEAIDPETETDSSYDTKRVAKKLTVNSEINPLDMATAVIGYISNISNSNKCLDNMDIISNENTSYSGIAENRRDFCIAKNAGVSGNASNTGGAWSGYKQSQE